MRPAPRAISPFDGAKCALLAPGGMVVILRDQLDWLPWAGHWDLPGGGREGHEDPWQCLARELHEELGLRISRAGLLWHRRWSPRQPGALARHFMVVRVSAAQLAPLRFGGEGQGWTLMPPARYLAHPRGIPHMQSLLRQAIRSRGAAATWGPLCPISAHKGLKKRAILPR